MVCALQSLLLGIHREEQIQIQTAAMLVALITCAGVAMAKSAVDKFTFTAIVKNHDISGASCTDPRSGINPRTLLTLFATTDRVNVSHTYDKAVAATAMEGDEATFVCPAACTSYVFMQKLHLAKYF
jgi:hypothetical protein